MSKNSDASHASNLANFKKLQISVDSLGTGYNPVKPSITASSLSTTYTNANNVLSTYNKAESDKKLTADARQAVFKNFSALATRIKNAFFSLDTTDEERNSLSSIIRKLKGEGSGTTKSSSSATTKTETTTDSSSTTTETTTNNTAQMDFENRINNFDKLIKFLEGVPAYIPNETDLNITGLKAYHASLVEKNNAANAAISALTAARIARNTVFYADKTGLVDIAGEVKNYVKSAFGATSAQYKSISSIGFVNYKE